VCRFEPNRWTTMLLIFGSAGPLCITAYVCRYLHNVCM
jgi:hypothetical protein